MKKSKYALNLAPDGRILSATYEEYAPPGAVLVAELPEGDISQYRYVDGNIIYDPLQPPDSAPDSAPDPITQRMDEIEAALVELAEMVAGGGL